MRTWPTRTRRVGVAVHDGRHEQPRGHDLLAGRHQAGAHSDPAALVVDLLARLVASAWPNASTPPRGRPRRPLRQPAARWRCRPAARRPPRVRAGQMERTGRQQARRGQRLRALRGGRVGVGDDAACATGECGKRKSAGADARAADDGTGRQGVAGATVWPAQQPNVQPVRSGPVRTDVQGDRPVALRPGRLGAQFHLLQGAQGEHGAKCPSSARRARTFKNVVKCELYCHRSRLTR